MSLSTLDARVYRTGEEPFLVHVLNPDMVAWDRYRAKHRLPAADVAPILWMTFVTWAAARRDKHIPTDMPYEAWETTTEHIEVTDADGNPLDADQGGAVTGEAVDPTHPVPDPG